VAGEFEVLARSSVQRIFEVMSWKTRLEETMKRKVDESELFTLWSKHVTEAKTEMVEKVTESRLFTLCTRCLTEGTLLMPEYN